jgi:hypothetical protein
MDRRSFFQLLGLAPLAALLPTPKQEPAYLKGQLDMGPLLRDVFNVRDEKFDEVIKDARARTLPMSCREALEVLRTYLFLRPYDRADRRGAVLINPRVAWHIDRSHIQASMDATSFGVWTADDAAKFKGFVGMLFPGPWASATFWKGSSEEDAETVCPIYEVYADPEVGCTEAYVLEHVEPEKFDSIITELVNGMAVDRRPKFDASTRKDLWKIRRPLP